MFSMWVVHFILVILLVANQAKKVWTLLVWSDVSEILFFCAGASESMNPSEEQDEVKEQKKKPDDVRLFKNKSYSKISLNDSDGFFFVFSESLVRFRNHGTADVVTLPSCGNKKKQSCVTTVTISTAVMTVN